MASGLEHLLEEGIISEVLGRLQSGKEAEVFVVRSGGKVVAAKVYKDRAQRSFKNNASYKEGRTVRNSRSQRAMDRGSSFGKAAAEDAWKSAEADALYRLYSAQVRVPAPVLFIDGVLLMELVLGADGQPAPRLIDTALTPMQASNAYRDMLTQLVRMLSCDLIHGDLSPYNVLWAAAGPTIIDFPQTVSAAQNGNSERFFLRDAQNILSHFVRFDRSLGARRGDAFEIWRAYMRRELTPDFFPSGRVAPPPRPAPVQGGFGGGRPSGDAASRDAASRDAASRSSHLGGSRAQGQRQGQGQQAPRGDASSPGRSNGNPGSGRSNGNPGPRAGGPAQGRPNAGPGRANAAPPQDQRRRPKAPEVLFARPRTRPVDSAPPGRPDAGPRGERGPSVNDEPGRGAPGRRPRFR